jgi:NAD(P)-dependent dehydrogenase (short-subunit alcohol dehydrogenase family)
MSETVVITGASAGVGRAVVREFAKRGARIGLLARGKERLEAAKREVIEAGGQAAALPADVADPGQVESAAAEVVRQFGPIDIWINNAMTTVFAPFTEITPAEYKRATEVTYLGAVYGTMSALRRMRPRDQGTIVQIGSALAYRSIPLQAPYCGAKHAIAGFTDSIRSELLHDRSKIHITMVHLPAMNTPQFSWCRSKLPNHPQPVPPIYAPEVAARAVYWASHHRRRELYVGMPTVTAIYAEKFLPGPADLYLGRTAYESQQTSEPVPADRKDNLFEPAPGDWAAHGVFGDRSSDSSAETWMQEHRTAVGAAVLAALGLTFMLARR